ncbi:hypothetical protein LTR78_002076 [Recurvomyces mirabilis]|uniref:Protein arginine N-methyltransferase n=1 Tax=Recurvomyces mirabilis TaxID=574656 RepID=A0AAE0WTR4_9PEZI|nr:hypothetical protein LTR78_002076 [Recurvomyces mirabilis]KAK5160534.1 hypothetical protein LTS14_001546 [Recurvomyces mirabilis]
MAGPEDPPTILFVGQHETQRTEAVTPELLYRAQNSGYDLLTAPITTSAFQSRVLETLQEYVKMLNASSEQKDVPLPLLNPLSPEDTNLVPLDSNSSLIAVTSPWIDLASHDPLIAHVSRQVFNLEVAYAAFVGINNILIHGPISSSGTMQYARTLLEGLGMGPYISINVLLPMSGELEQDISADGIHLSELTRPEYAEEVEDVEEGEGETEVYDAWETWNTIRTVCNYSTKLSIALELPRQLPAVNLQSRWYSEPIRLLPLPRTSFWRNGKGFPVLSKQHQQYLTQFLRLRFPPWVLLSDVGAVPSLSNEAAARASSEPTPAEAAADSNEQPLDLIQHLKYMRHLQQSQPTRPPIERFGQGYQDYMQSPLQPLTDNLESITYEVFEKDPVKYEWYERAIALALKDLREKLGEQRKVVVAVVGAGRGPLVTRALQASRSTGIGIQCYAVEKNPNAHVLLQHRNATDPLWNKQVTVVKSDMRTWSGPPTMGGKSGKVDILVSELLGSFADNELSPECLDGVQHVLDPNHGINIPQSYSAHLTPIASPKLHGDLLGRASTDLNMTMAEKWELPYVVMLHQFDYLSTVQPSAEDPRTPVVQEAWSFWHPISTNILDLAKSRADGHIDAGGHLGGDGTNEHNSRSCKVTFRCAHRGVCHGIGGYFETVLYSSPTSGQKIELSTNPVTMADKSKDMISWFPIFFPLKTPIYVPDDAEMEVSMWRQTDDRKAWYEWIVDVYIRMGSRRMKLGGSDLHSCRRNGCLM